MKTIINSQLYNFYERESKTLDEYIKNICIEAMELIKKIGIEKEANQEAIDFLKKFIDIKLQTYQYDYKNETHRNLTKIVETSKNYSRVIKDENNNYNCYPFSVSEPSYYNIIINYCLTSNLSIDESNTQINNLINFENKTKLEDFLKNNLNNYYGNVEYIITKTKAVFDATKMLLERNDLSDEDKVLTLNTFQEINTILNKIHEIANITNINELKTNNFFDEGITLSKEQYDTISSLYQNIIKYEKTLEPITQKIWNNFYNTNQGMLIHKLTGTAVESNRMNKICTSLISENEAYIPEYQGNIGYCYNFDINNVLAVCETDIGSWPVTKNKFIKREFPKRWQYDESNIWYENAYNSKLFTPEYLEQKIIENNHFAEIVLDNKNQTNKPIMAYYTENASEEEIQKITELAIQQNINVEQLSFSNQNKYQK